MTHVTNFLLSRYYFLFLLFILSISYFAFGTYRNWPYKIESDGKYYYQYLVSALLDKDIDFSNNYKAIKYDWMRTEIDHYKFRERVNTFTGRPTNVFTIGPAILWVPFFAFGYVLANFLNAIHFSVDINPYGRYFQYAVMYSAVIYTVVALYLLYRLLIQYFSEIVSRLAVWLILMTTPLYYYAVFEPSMSHVYDFFTFIFFLFIFQISAGKNSVPLCAMLALGGALHILVRTQNLITIFLFSLLMLFYLRDHDLGVKTLLSITAYTLVLSAGLLPIPVINNYIYGSPFVIPQGNNFLNPANPKVLQIVFSMRNGLFSHHPLLLVGLIGYVGFLITFPRGLEKYFLGFLLLVFSLQVYMNSIVADWWAGHSFGQRRLISSFPLFAFGFAYLLDKAQVSYPKLYRRFGFIVVTLLTLFGFYLTMIHVFLWDYKQPHNIFAWMFYYAPIWALHQF